MKMTRTNIYLIKVGMMSGTKSGTNPAVAIMLALSLLVSQIV
jgi:hypothetical protein